MMQQNYSQLYLVKFLDTSAKLFLSRVDQFSGKDEFFLRVHMLYFITYALLHFFFIAYL